MEITRRRFVAGSMAGVGALALPSFLLQAASGEAYAAADKNYADAFSTLSRLSFGPTAQECAALLKQGLTSHLEEQLAPDNSADPLCNQYLAKATLNITYQAGARAETEIKDKNGTVIKIRAASYSGVDEDRPLASLTQPPEELWAQINANKFMDSKERYRPVQEVRAATWIRAVYSRWQLREVMTEFWHNHFNVQAFSQPQISATFPQYDSMIRRHCFGNFREFLEDVAKSPAMLYYLGNVKSRASYANENYARELFEQHTLGTDYYYNTFYNRWRDVQGASEQQPIGYIDQDVYEAARAFTGWTVEDGSNTWHDIIFPSTGKFTYFYGWHDTDQKHVLANTFAANTLPMEDGQKVLDLLSAHPGTAEYICTKLCRRFWGDTPPPELVKKAINTWRHAMYQSDQIAQVLRTILLSPEFTEARGKKIKRPFEFAISFLRGTGAGVRPNEAMFDALENSGYRQFEWPTPNGHPDVAEHWLNTNTTLGNWNFLPASFGDNFTTSNNARGVTYDLAQQTPANIRTFSEIITYWYNRLTGLTPDARTLAGLMQFMPEPQNGSKNDQFVPIRDAGFKQALQEMVMTIAMLPAFSWRG